MPGLNPANSLRRRTWKKKLLNGEDEESSLDELARTALRIAYNHIREGSLKQAEKVKQEIIAASKKLADHPEMHPPDKYRKDKDIRFRAFEKYNYRISYFIAEDTIRVLRFRHVKQEPKEY